MCVSMCESEIEGGMVGFCAFESAINRIVAKAACLAIFQCIFSVLTTTHLALGLTKIEGFCVLWL